MNTGMQIAADAASDMRKASGILKLDRRPLSNAVARMLDSAAGRLDQHPDATGPMTQHAYKIARCVLDNQ